MKNENKCIRQNVDLNLIKKAKDEIKKLQVSLNEKSMILNLLGNEVRLSIVFLLLNYKKLCVCDISDILELSQSSISQHLRKLKDANLIFSQRDGLLIHYFIENKMNKKLNEILDT